MATKCESIVIFISLYHIIIQSSVITGNVIISESQDPPLPPLVLHAWGVYSRRGWVTCSLEVYIGSFMEVCCFVVIIELVVLI
jgi:hypothetical protein